MGVASVGYEAHAIYLDDEIVAHAAYLLTLYKHQFALAARCIYLDAHTASALHLAIAGDVAHVERHSVYKQCIVGRIEACTGLLGTWVLPTKLLGIVAQVVV